MKASKKNWGGRPLFGPATAVFSFFPQKMDLFQPFRLGYHQEMMSGHPQSVWQPLPVSEQPFMDHQVEKIEDLALLVHI